MTKLLPIATAALAFGLAGCAVDPAATSQTASKPKDNETITGSRIPRPTSGDQPVTQMTGETWKRESSSAIGNQPTGK